MSMKRIFGSASKFTLVMYAFVLSVAFLYVVIANATQEAIATAVVGLASNVIVAVFSFYFGQKSRTPDASGTFIDPAE